ncbi:MAG TPA: hypothetical protein VNO43_11545 [Candidatus Eisenbacteria bacterium]|nr:hypothetical protein [Candidatus Eisenbacteria bacterium]
MARSLPVQPAVARRQTAQRDRPVARNLQIEEDPGFQTREWQVQRAGWAILGLLAALAALGVFGTGVFSRTSVQADGLKVEYERFGRLRRPDAFRISFNAQGPGQVLISREYLDHFTIEDISPRPDRVEATAGWLAYSFPVRDGMATVTFHLQPEAFGRISGAVRLADGESITFEQFIYP